MPLRQLFRNSKEACGNTNPRPKKPTPEPSLEISTGAPVQSLLGPEQNADCGRGGNTCPEPEKKIVKKGTQLPVQAH